MLTEIGALLESNDAKSPFRVAADRLFFTGESQSGNCALTCYQFFQSDAVIVRKGRNMPIHDGFLLEAATTPAGAPVRQCAVPLPAGNPQIAVPDRGCAAGDDQFAIGFLSGLWRRVQACL